MCIIVVYLKISLAIISKHGKFMHSLQSICFTASSQNKHKINHLAFFSNFRGLYSFVDIAETIEMLLYSASIILYHI